MSLIDEEENIIRQRLIAKEPTLKLKKITQKFLNFASSQSSDECTKIYHELLGMLLQFQFNVSKDQIVANTSEREIDYYDKLYQERTRDIERVKTEIAQLKIELDKEKQIRKNKEEYESLAKIINDYPTRSETEKEISELKRGLEALEDESSSLNTKIELRSKQFQLFLHAVQELQTELQEEQEAEERKKENEKRELVINMEEDKEEEEIQVFDFAVEAATLQPFKEKEDEDKDEDEREERLRSERAEKPKDIDIPILEKEKEDREDKIELPAEIMEVDTLPDTNKSEQEKEITKPIESDEGLIEEGLIEPNINP